MNTPTDRSSAAYRVPFTVERHGRRIVLRNMSDERIEALSLTMHGGGVVGTSSPSSLIPGQAIEIWVSGRELARSSILVVRWFRPNGDEYLWRLSF